LFHRDEKLVDTEHAKILLANSRTIDKKIVERAIANLQEANRANDSVKMKGVLHALVPEHLTQVGQFNDSSQNTPELASQK
jgi:hypothetical protein